MNKYYELLQNNINYLYYIIKIYIEDNHCIYFDFKDKILRKHF